MGYVNIWVDIIKLICRYWWKKLLILKSAFIRMKIKFNKTEVPNISQKLLNKIIKIKNKKARILAFSGTLGAGKTTITQEIAKQVGIKNNIVSPTFVIMKFYEINPSSKYYIHFKRLIHIDAYRLESAPDLINIGWKEITEDKENLIIIEWPENVKECIDKDAYWVKLEHVDDQTRLIEF